MIKFDKLWIMIEKRGLSKYKLTSKYNISKAQLSRLKHNQSVTTNTLDKLCNLLQCKVEDIMEHVLMTIPLKLKPQ